MPTRDECKRWISAHHRDTELWGEYMETAGADGDNFGGWMVLRHKPAFDSIFAKISVCPDLWPAIRNCEQIP